MNEGPVVQQVPIHHQQLPTGWDALCLLDEQLQVSDLSMWVTVNLHMAACWSQDIDLHW
jgi:ABC-type uncharacterized transport system permease subunit